MRDVSELERGLLDASYYATHIEKTRAWPE